MTPRTHETFRRESDLGRLDYSQSPAAVYYVASNSARRRIHQCRMVGGRFSQFPTAGVVALQHRVFEAKSGVPTIYTRAKCKIWRLAEAQLDHQLAAAEFLAQMPDVTATDGSAT